MGYTWEVEAWVRMNNEEADMWDDPDFGYKQVYAGESLWQAIKAMRKAKRDGAGCVTLHWR